MQKKIMAAAVAGALALPVTAIAQTSTVNIYGRITYEYGIADQGRGRPNVDYADSPGGSAIGFRGEEKLGGGLSAWFQCESSADVRALDQTGWCTRNSAVGFKGGFGNVFFGRWDTPLKRAMNVGTVGAEETGILGNSFLPFGGSGGSDISGTGNAVAAGIETQQRQRFKRREAGLSYYESPSFGGFQVMGAFSTGNAAADNPVAGPLGCNAAGTPCNNDKPRLLSLGAIYSAGPIGIGAGYEKHMEMGALGGPVDLDDTGFGFSGAYTWGPVKVGGTWLRRKFETAAARDLRIDSWTIGVDWAIVGPHSLSVQYAQANDSKGNSLTRIGGNGGAEAPRAVVGGTEVGVSDTGAKSFTIAYSYAFSKRTRVKLGYIVVDNDSNANIARIGNTATLIAGAPAPGTANGQKVDGYAFHISHSF